MVITTVGSHAQLGSPSRCLHVMRYAPKSARHERAGSYDWYCAGTLDLKASDREPERRHEQVTRYMECLRRPVHPNSLRAAPV